MTSFERLRSWFRPAAYLGRNPLTLAGAVLTTSSAFTLIAFWLFDIAIGGTIHPYVGLIFFLVLPGIFLIGLILMPIGALFHRLKLARAGQLPAYYPQVDFSMPSLRQALGWVAGLTVANIIIFSVGTYRGVEYMDSVRFCGQTCHIVMQPEFTAYQNSPHQRVACVQCHIGPGASWFVRSKLSGLHQVYAVTFHTYDRPIPVPVANLRPARETCEACHWPQMFTGSKLLVLRKFSDDEKNTELTTVLLLKIGGRTWEGGSGIHGHHLDVKEPFEYVALDHQRQNIAQVSYTDASGKRLVFTQTDPKPTKAQLAAGERRVMDCIDCHNRPTHTFQLPERAVDQAMAQGGISPDLPYIKKEAVEVLKAKYLDRDTATREIAATVDAFYSKSYPDMYRDKHALVETSISQVQAVYLRNIFPAMNVTWGTYPNNIGHMDFPGCFRCHDGTHSTPDGRTIPNDCGTCHTMLAMDEQNPKVLTDLGIK
ncbi:MAG TPA: NapC/NirT family cytochrome c [Candidatus Limnocylindrales bacterium]|nr:NapC/NirT family cytochrome c [Candidatus Limnocylindrales bacterium]